MAYSREKLVEYFYKAGHDNSMEKTMEILYGQKLMETLWLVREGEKLLVSEDREDIGRDCMSGAGL